MNRSAGWCAHMQATMDREKRAGEYSRKYNEWRSQTMTGERCPKCGGGLRYRKGKYGTFVGCNNYPSCKHSRNLNSWEKSHVNFID